MVTYNGPNTCKGDPEWMDMTRGEREVPVNRV